VRREVYSTAETVRNVAALRELAARAWPGDEVRAGCDGAGYAVYVNLDGDGERVQLFAAHPGAFIAMQAALEALIKEGT
jgi:hypothetical protein